MKQGRAVVVVGGSGLIGRAIQERVVRNNDERLFSFSFRDNKNGIQRGVRSFKMDLLRRPSENPLASFPSAVYVAGSSNHSLAIEDLATDLQLNLGSFVKFMQVFKGELVLLSSQAVYYGLSGVVREQTPHIAEIPYGLSKRMVEEYAKYYLRTGRLSKLWIVRLMYSFGVGERSSRLIPSCARAVTGHAKLVLRGKGTSFLNPLPAWFVAEVLLRMVGSQGEQRSKLTVTNLNHPELIRVIDVVRFLQGVSRFDYSAGGKEEWPVRFSGDTGAVSRHLERWGLEWPDPWKEMKAYFGHLVDGGVGN